MQRLDYYLPRPPYALTPEKQAAFEALYQATPTGEVVDYHLPYPKWEYLTYLCATRELVLHGSAVTGLAVVEPRQARDVRAFSNQQAIYATTDGIWVIYFAIIDRRKYGPLSLFNACFQAGKRTNQLSDPFYFFSISQPALLRQPWCEGAVYILPRQAFQQEPAQQMLGYEVVFPHWISAQAARPAAALRVGPQDFPFLEQIHGHNDEKLARLAAADPNGFPWPEALES
jgi:hypothetical protein